MYKYFFNPVIATNIILFILVIYVIILYKNDIFDKNFFHFGPGTNKENTIDFIHTKIDTWPKVWTVWTIGFTTTALQNYYWSTISDYIYLNIRNPNVKNINCSKESVTFIIYSKYIISTILSVLSMFTYLTGQLQFILPSLITSILISGQVNLHFLHKKDYKKPKNKSSFFT